MLRRGSHRTPSNAKREQPIVSSSGDGRMIGTCDIDEIADNTGDLGYWLDETEWGRGFATEAARAVTAFGFGQLALTRLTSGHAADNPNSGRILTKLGFVAAGRTRLWSKPRAAEIDQLKYELPRSAAGA
jgi:RimJ/RimL family protein N-acetyltransferase